MIERAAVAIQALLEAAPELASARDTVQPWLTRELGLSKVTLAELGLTADKGFAAFDMHHGGSIVVVPLADRDKFLARMHGKTEGDHDVVGDTQCKSIGSRYVCADNPRAVRQDRPRRLRRHAADRRRAR
jgi:hypothetical protein